MKIAITGATGFLGSNLSRALQQAGHTIHALVRDEAKMK
ncbi:MAG: NAD-dependent epimerase/dehydratase family protein, partial [Proteobacteria bacterium]|nr:NAD-dependent epimerase/dehydratase family protein [Pseudomonadota bacterium]